MVTESRIQVSCDPKDRQEYHGTCPSPWIKGTYGCYYNTGIKQWYYDAISTCKSYGAELINPKCEKEAVEIRDLRLIRNNAHLGVTGKDGKYYNQDGSVSSFWSKLGINQWGDFKFGNMQWDGRFSVGVISFENETICYKNPDREMSHEN